MEGAPARKMRRIVDDDDDNDELPDINDPAFLHPPKAVTPQATKDDASDEGGLFSDDEGAEKEGSGSPGRKRYVRFE
jgi:hypothetical protein